MILNRFILKEIQPFLLAHYVKRWVMLCHNKKALTRCKRWSWLFQPLEHEQINLCSLQMVQSQVSVTRSIHWAKTSAIQFQDWERLSISLLPYRFSLAESPLTFFSSTLTWYPFSAKQNNLFFSTWIRIKDDSVIFFCGPQMLSCMWVFNGYYDSSVSYLAAVLSGMSTLYFPVASRKF